MRSDLAYLKTATDYLIYFGAVGFACHVLFLRPITAKSLTGIAHKPALITQLNFPWTLCTWNP